MKKSLIILVLLFSFLIFFSNPSFGEVFKCFNENDNKKIIEVKDFWLFGFLNDITNTSDPIKFKVNKFNKYHISAKGTQKIFYEDGRITTLLRGYEFDRINNILVETFNIENASNRKDDVSTYTCKKFN